MKVRILFFIESLAGGGAEKVLSTLVKHIDHSMFDVTVCVISGGGRYEKEVADSVKYVSVLRDSSSYTGIWKLWYVLKYKCIYEWLPMWLVYRLFVPKGYDVEVAFVEGFATNLLAASSNKKAKKVAWVHCDLENQPWTIQQGIFRSIQEERTSYCRYDKVVCVSRKVENVMQNVYGLSNTITLYNPLDVWAIKENAKQSSERFVSNEKYNIISIGRLEKVKGYKELLSIMCRLVKKHDNIHLWLVGDGSEKKNLQKQVKELGIEDNVTFTGFLANPYSLLARMNLYVCSSKAEGYNLAVAEAMILGIPVVSMNSSGVSEQLFGLESLCICGSYDGLEVAIEEIYNGVRTLQYKNVVNLEERINCIEELFNELTFAIH